MGEAQVSESQLQRWRKQITKVTDTLKQNGFSAGAAIDIVYSEKEQRDFKIAPFGRLESREGEYTFRAGPIDQPNPALFDFPKSCDMGIAVGFAKGTWRPDVKGLMTELADPVPKKVERITPQIAKTEASLFYHMEKNFGPICVVNPSFVTLKSLRDRDFFVWMTDSSYDDTIRKQLKELRIRTEIVHSDPKKIMCYIGSADPAVKPERYVRLQINPYSDWAETNHMAYGESGDGVDITYQKQSRMVTDRISDGDPLYRYNPSTVNKHFGGDSCFWLISNEPLSIQEIECDKIPHTPKFLEDLGTSEIEEGYKVWRNREKEVTDVEGEGTYFSRKARFIAMYPNTQWAPYMKTGAIVLTRYTVRPRYSSYYSSDNHAEGITHIFSDVRVTCVQVIEINGKSIAMCTNGKRFSEPGQFSKDAIGFSPSEAGDYVLAGFPKGMMRKIGVSTVPGQKHYLLDVKDLKGIWYVFPMEKDYGKYKWSVILSSVNWNNFLAHSSSDNTYQSKTYVSHRTLLETRIKEARLTTWADKGVTRQEIADTWTQAIPLSLAETYVSSFPHVVDVGGSFVSLIDQDSLCFPGERKQLPCVDGHMVSSVYRYLIDVGELVTLNGSSDYHLYIFGEWLRQLPFEVRDKPGMISVYELAFNSSRKGYSIPEFPIEITRRNAPVSSVSSVRDTVLPSFYGNSSNTS